MVRGEEDKTSQAILSTLTRIDLYHHSLRMAADKLMAQIGSAEGADASVELRERSLELGRECSDVLGSLRGLVNEDERGPVDSALDTVDLALTRASGASNETLHLLNIWRVVEATERLVSVLGDRHGYESISGESVPVVNDEREVKGARLVRLFGEYEDAMAREPSPVAEGGPPFEHGILQWRGNQLYYVQRVEDGARWVELDPAVWRATRSTSCSMSTWMRTSSTSTFAARRAMSTTCQDTRSRPRARAGVVVSAADAARIPSGQ